MKYICCDCMKKFDEDEMDSRYDNVGEFWGSPAYMTIGICPFCGSEDFDEYEEISKGEMLVRCVDTLESIRKAIKEGKFKTTTDVYAYARAKELKAVIDFINELEEELEEQEEQT